MLELSQRLTKVASSHICDALAHIGVTNVVTSSLRPVSEPGLVMAGPAVVLELVRARTPDAPRQLSRFLQETVQPGSVVVIAAHGITDYVCFGGRAALTARMHGAVGAIVDGGVRDVPELRGKGFPVFSTGFGLHASEGYLEGIRINEPAFCAGLKIEPGDIVVGDDTGIVVVPKGTAQRVTELAEEREEIDRESMVQLAAGGTLEVTHRHFKDDDVSYMRKVE